MEECKISDYSDVERVLFQIAVGNTVKLVPESFNLASKITQTVNPNQTMYQWKLFVSAFDETDVYHRILEKIVSKVTFQLDRTFVNHTVRVLEAPIQCTQNWIWRIRCQYSNSVHVITT
jgi:transcription initiation factor IIF auxiliary subunit